MTQKHFAIILLAMLCVGCGIQVDVNGATTPTGFIITSTLPPTLTPPPSQTPLPLPPQPTTAPVLGTTSTQVNVRAEPSTTSEVLGIIPPNTTVEIIGKDAGENWWQILYQQGVDGKGWVNAAFVQATGVENLPIVTSGNVVVGTGTPTEIPLPSAPTVIPAPADGDSVVSPAVNITLTSAGTKSFQYSSDVSSPEGDIEDWIQFTTFTQIISIELECIGSESYIAEILQNNSVMQNLVCGRIIVINTSPDAVYAVHFQSSPTGELQYTRFTLRVEATP